MTIYAEDLENMVYKCISAKLAGLEAMNRAVRKEDAAEINHLKRKTKAIEKAENQILDTILAGGDSTMPCWPSPTRKPSSSSRTDYKSKS